MIDSCDDRERGVQLVTLSQNDVAMATSRNFQAFSRLIGDAGVGGCCSDGTGCGRCLLTAKYLSKDEFCLRLRFSGTGNQNRPPDGLPGIVRQQWTCHQ